MSRSAVSIVLVLAVVAAPSGHGAAQRDALIRPGIGIGKIRLGMTQAQVFRVLGRTTVVNRRLSFGFGTRYVEYDWSYGAWSVGFTGRRNALRVSKIATTLRRERTARRIGVDSTVRAILRVFPHAACVGRWYSDPDPGTWVYVGGSPRMTAFNILYTGPAHQGRVAQVVVQRAWISPSRGRGCPPNWRTR